MRIWVCSNIDAGRAASRALAADLVALGFDAVASEGEPGLDVGAVVRLTTGVPAGLAGPSPGWVPLDGPETLLERALRAIPLDFASLPLHTEGDSKEVRRWTERVVVIRLKPTVYSFTANRYGMAVGTDEVRAAFTSAVFRRLAAASPPAAGGVAPRSAFLAEVPSPGGRLLIQRRVELSNLETRIKRYHVGSPLHRYQYTEHYPSTLPGEAPIRRWTRFETPLVCFDWRLPLQDEAGHRLADEPISDDYAAVWMRNVPDAKAMARSTFLLLERMFAVAGVRLVDMCLMIDREGRTIHGEISPDCMRLRMGFGDPQESAPLDKDLWRTGRSADELRDRYDNLYRTVFPECSESLT